MSQAPPIVNTLIDRFEQNRESYKSQGYNETQLRREFLDPFFEALGWDVANKQGHAEAYKDVIHEDAIKIGGYTKAPDYCFRIGGARKFFLEAKKPSINLKDEPAPAYQLRRYAWSAKLPLSILTDFEEFAVYDCRTRPNPSDKPSTGRILYLTYRDYLAKWGEIASIFTKEAVLKGSFDKYAVTDRKRGTATVDAEFLKEIETWREALAKNLALRNPTLSVHELNFSVQRTIDRLIFLRICEDRGVEPYAQLQALLNGQNIYGRLRYLYDQADDRYNSGLFHFHPEKDRAESPDDLTPRLKIDDKVLKEILGRLYYPQSPYEFSVLPIEILGQVYEQFLGKVIRLTAGHQAKVEEKPEVKKAGGVYYTPAYIVEYIVKHTVGTLCEGKTPKQIAKLTILDPACGSGSFLIGAYRYLLTYHRDWYVKDGPEKHRKELFQAASGDWRLTTQEKKRILLNNIYGVDIDSQAVEVTKLSLLLKVLEGESDETLKRQLSFVHERALPDLGQNIKCGNSLIGSDYFAGQLMPDEDEMRRVNPFDWQAEFPEVMKAGGFDVVIGNPPYVRQESLSVFKEYLSQHYEAYDGVADLYAYFMEKSVTLFREGGRFSFIVSSSFLRTTYGAALRRTLKKQAAVLRILDFGGLAVFENAKDTYVCIPLLAKTKQPSRIEVSRIPSLDFASLDDSAIDHRFTIPQERLLPEAWSLKSDEAASVASSSKVKENDGHDESHSSAGESHSSKRQVASLAPAAGRSGDEAGSLSGPGAGMGGGVDEVRERTGDYGPSSGTSGQSEEHQAGSVGSTRYVDTAEGIKPYTEVAERLAVQLTAILRQIVDSDPATISITPEWLCLCHRDLAGALFPDWAGRFRDRNVQIGRHQPPPFYEVPVHIRLFCDDLAVRLRHIQPDVPDLHAIAELLAVADGRFQSIHPFRDFNGRVGRVLLVALLYILGLPPVEIVPSGPEFRQAYFEALNAADQGEYVLLTEMWLRRLVEAL